MILLEPLGVEHEPEVALGGYRVIDYPTGEPDGGRELRLVGITLSGPLRVRISSGIVAWDREAGRATTASGRVYRLVPDATLPDETAGWVEKVVATYVGMGGREVAHLDGAPAA